jgi:dTDP-4-amino-4,6-dideoxygalactose transaminase
MPSFKRHDTIDCWYNYRLPEIAAAVALGEFERMDDLVAMREQITSLLI